MDNFEALVRLLLEQEGYWTRQSQKVNLSKEEKIEIGKPSIPRPEIDVIGYNPASNTVIAMEVKSYFDSPGVPCSELEKGPFQQPEGKYKLFTSPTYRKIVFSRLRSDLGRQGLADDNTTIKLGLAAGKVMKDRQNELKEVGERNGWVIWTPKMIASKTRALAEIGYENDPFVVTAKLLERNRK